MTKTLDIPVLVVGAGVAGLATSLFLAEHGVRSLLVERHPGTSIYPRARGVNGRTMELARELGLADEIRSALPCVTSSDGTVISYRSLGRGPALVLLHGGLQAAHSFGELAAALAETFTVIVPTRRGRAGADPLGAPAGLAAEVSDLDAVLRATGARRVFGLSSGAVIALAAALTRGGIDQLALYEPPLRIDGLRPDAWAPRLERELARGDVAAAMVTLLKGTGDVAPLTYAPRFAFEALLGFLLRRERVAPDQVPLRTLIQAMRYDCALIRETPALADQIASLGCEVLLLGGTRSALCARWTRLRPFAGPPCAASFRFATGAGTPIASPEVTPYLEIVHGQRHRSEVRSRHRRLVRHWTRARPAVRSQRL